MVDANQLLLLAQALVSGLLVLIGKDMVSAAFPVAQISTHHYYLLYSLLCSFLVLFSNIWSHNLNSPVLSLPLLVCLYEHCLIHKKQQADYGVISCCFMSNYKFFFPKSHMENKMCSQ